MSKVKKPLPPKPVWVEVTSRDVKYEAFLLSEFLGWIKSSIPEGTKDEDVQISFNIEQTPTYYDEILIDAEMNISIRKQ